MRNLTVGDRGPEVGYMQRLLNYENLLNGLPEPDLTEDCAFGPRTLARLNSHQRQDGLPESSTVNGLMWQRLGHAVAVEHAVELFPQPTTQSCWSAAATMLFGDRSVGAAGAELTDGHLLDDDPDNIRTFLTGNGLTFHEPRQWTVRELIDMLRHGPLWAAGRWRETYRSGRTQRGGHVVVISAIWAHQSISSGGCALRIHDPWPPGRGAIYGACYEAFTIRALSRRGMSFNAGMLALAHR